MLNESKNVDKSPGGKETKGCIIFSSTHLMCEKFRTWVFMCAEHEKLTLFVVFLVLIIVLLSVDHCGQD